MFPKYRKNVSKMFPECFRNFLGRKHFENIFLVFFRHFGNILGNTLGNNLGNILQKLKFGKHFRETFWKHFGRNSIFFTRSPPMPDCPVTTIAMVNRNSSAIFTRHSLRTKVSLAKPWLKNQTMRTGEDYFAH